VESRNAGPQFGHLQPRLKGTAAADILWMIGLTVALVIAHERPVERPGTTAVSAAGTTGASRSACGTSFGPFVRGFSLNEFSMPP